MTAGADDPVPGLGSRQAAVMQLLWSRAGEHLTVREVADALDDGLAYTTVMTVLTRLHQKGFVDRRQRGRAWAYRATGSRSDHAARTMAAVFRDAGDRHGALLRFVDGLTADEQQALRDRLARGDG